MSKNKVDVTDAILEDLKSIRNTKQIEVEWNSEIFTAPELQWHATDYSLRASRDNIIEWRRVWRRTKVCEMERTIFNRCWIKPNKKNWNSYIRWFFWRNNVCNGLHKHSKRREINQRNQATMMEKYRSALLISLSLSRMELQAAVM